LTREHVLSAWLGQFIRMPMPNYKSVEGYIGAAGSTLEAPVTRSGHPASRRVRCVCGPCNNGWMSEIVGAAKPIVEKLIKGEPCRLMAEERVAVSAWIATAVIVSEFENPDLVTIPDRHRDWLMNEHTAPPDWNIWIGDYERGRWVGHWIHHRFSVTGPEEPAPGKLQEGPVNTQTTTYVAGRLYVHALSSAVAGGALDWKFAGRDLGVLRKIWPASDFSFVWPPPTMSDTDADRVASAMLEFSLGHLGLPRPLESLPGL
jgi:hypothetical protein